MIDLSMVTLFDEFSQKVNFDKVASEINNQGEAEIIGTESIILDAIVQPAGQEDLQLLQEGERNFPTMAIDTMSELSYGDLMYFHDKRWRIVHVADWSSYGYYHYVAVRYDGTESSDSGGFGIPEDIR